jgi:hypothetical protein
VAAREEARAFAAELEAVRPRRALQGMPRLTPDQATVPGLVRLLNRRGHEVAAVRLSGEDVPVEAWKVVVRGFLVTELL